MKLDIDLQQRRRYARILATITAGHEMPFFATMISTAFNCRYGSKPLAANYNTYTATAGTLWDALSALKDAVSNDVFADFSPLASDEIFVGRCGDSGSISSVSELIAEDEQEVRDWDIFEDSDWDDFKNWQEEESDEDDHV